MAPLSLRLTTPSGSERTLTVLSCGSREVVVRDAVDGSVLVWRSTHVAQQVARFLNAEREATGGSWTELEKV